MKVKRRSLVEKNSKSPLFLSLLITGLFIFHIGNAQNDLPILSWRTHFSYDRVNAITTDGDRVYAAAENALFYLDLEENSINLINKNTGLSDVGIEALAFDTNTNRLIITYQNGNIDFWTDGVTTNINTIKTAEITGSKRLMDIQVFENRLYISGDLGIIVYDLSREEITESYQNLGPNGERLIIYQTTFANDSIYAVSESGILSASLESNVNRQDFNNWQRTLTGIEFQRISHIDGSIYAGAGSDLFSYQNDSWTFDQNVGEEITTLNAVTTNSLYILTKDRLLLKDDQQGITTLYNSSSENQLLNDLLIGSEKIWLASSDQGLLQFNSFNSEPVQIKPPGPSSDIAVKPAFLDDRIYWISGANTQGISVFNLENQTWNNFRTTDENNDPIENLTDIDLGIVNQSQITAPVFSSFEKGLFFGGGDNTNSISINESFSNTSPLTMSNGSFNVTAIEAENENALWVATSGFQNSLHSWNPSSDSWNSFELNTTSFPRDLLIAPNGNKWLSIDPSRGGGIVVFDEVSSRERRLNINGGQGGLPGNEVTSMTIDQNLFLWVGTDQGIAFFPNPSIVLENRPLTANIPIFENRLLLRDEFITQVVVDPANRKWFGTRNNGLWLFSETGEALVYHFKADNSPLPSDNITSLYLDPPSGELFIGTDKGMVSFRSDATEGSNRHENVQIYPNPVNPSFQGNIIITGLVNNGFVKITDVSGKLVREIRANGSTAIWNARDINGGRVSSGVYLVFSSNLDGTETYAGKIVVI